MANHRQLLPDRNIQIKVGTSLGRIHKCTLGLPQGSILSPLLFIFYVSDMLQDATSDAWKYADDASVLSVSPDKAISLRQIQNDLDLLLLWTNKWRFKLNCNKGKTEAIAINFDPATLGNNQLHFGNKDIAFVEESKVLGVWLDGNLSWDRQQRTVAAKCWGAWKKIKALCSNYQGLKISTIVSLIKIAVLLIMFYAAPVWMTGKENIFKKLWQDILKTTTVTPNFHPSVKKMEIITSLPPLDIQLETIVVKFLLKNFYMHHTDLLSTQIQESYQDTFKGNFVKQHCNYLKEYIGFMKGYERCQRIDLKCRDVRIKYTKISIWNFIRMLWKRRIQNMEFDEYDYTPLIKQKPLQLPCNRTIESFICGGILNRLPLFGFLNNRNLATSPLCSCQAEVECLNHLLFDCHDFMEERNTYGIAGTNIVEYVTKEADLKPLCRLASKIYANKGIKTRYDLFRPETTDVNDCTNQENTDYH